MYKDEDTVTSSAAPKGTLSWILKLSSCPSEKGKTQVQGIAGVKGWEHEEATVTTMADIYGLLLEKRAPCGPVT